ncbi:MAG: OsmC family protein [Planctomycetes bacterium]|nr:OsmC family protein [Planctomycetota bacterium]MCB9934628.1 OsmC family protein [Planctomycetota bacterium]
MRAVVRLTDSFRTEIKVDPGLAHTIIADEPAEAGGANTGPTAMGLLAAALGACTAATLRSYANLKGIALESVEVEVEAHRRKPSEQAEAGEGAKATLVTKKITLKGELTDDQRKRMLEIAEKCPVNRALLQGVDLVHE